MFSSSHPSLVVPMHHEARAQAVPGGRRPPFVLFRQTIFEKIDLAETNRFRPKIVKIRAILAIFQSFEDFRDFRFGRFGIPFGSIDIASEGRGGLPCFSSRMSLQKQCFQCFQYVLL